MKRFHEVEETCLAGGFLDAGDAASLSKCFLPDEEESMGIVVAGLRRPEMKGLLRLTQQLAVLLNEAYVAQQGALAGLKTECAQCSRIATTSAAHFSNLSLANDAAAMEGGTSDINSSTSGGVTIKGGSAWASLPSADEEDLDGPASSDAPLLTQRIAGFFSSSSSSSSTNSASNRSLPAADSAKRRWELLRQQLQHQMQSVHDRAVDLLDAKLQAHKSVAHCQRAFTRALVRQAAGSGVTRVSLRASLLVDSAMVSLRTHKFLETSDPQDIVAYVRELWAATYLDSNKVLAERQLLLTHAASAPWLSRGQSAWHVKLGVGLALLAWGLSECFNNEDEGRGIWRDPTFAIFMCFGDLLLLFWMWGASMQVWRSAGIDFVKLLDLEGTEVASQLRPEHHVYSSATNLTLIFLGVFIWYNKAARGVLHVPGSSLALAHSLPVLMVLYFAYCFVSPYETRKQWLAFLGQVLAAPFYPVVFRDGYVGDLLTSLVRVLVPLCFSFSYLLFTFVAWLSEDHRWDGADTDMWWKKPLFRLFWVPFLTLFPLWIRLMQCLRRSVETGKRWPHYANALKYTSAIVVIAFGTFQPNLRADMIWRAGFVFATLFQYSWDLTMDWGIIVSARHPGASSYTMCGLALRRVRLLGGLGVYTGIMVSNLLLRFAWTLTLMPVDPSDKSLLGLVLVYLAPLIAAAEIVRRMVWGFLRLEHEQLETLGESGAGVGREASIVAGSSSVSSTSDGMADLLGLGSGSGSGVKKGFPFPGPEAAGFELPSLSSGGSEARGGLLDPDGRYSALPLLQGAETSQQSSGPATFSWWEREYLPLPVSLLELVAQTSGLGAVAAGRAARVRLVEGGLFAAAVLAVVLVAAFGAL